MPPPLYHATTPLAARAILSGGFEVWVDDPDIGRYARCGCLGNGIYVSPRWQIALWFGQTLLAVETVPGTRILDIHETPEPRVIDHLRREFGHEVLQKPPWKSLPRNKQLTGAELVALVRHHCHGLWGKPPRRDTARRRNHADQIEHLAKMLRRYGYHGFGHPENDLGYVVFDPTRLLARHILAQIPAPRYHTLWDTDFAGYTLPQICRSFPAPAAPGEPPGAPPDPGPTAPCVP